MLKPERVTEEADDPPTQGYSCQRSHYLAQKIQKTQKIQKSKKPKGTQKNPKTGKIKPEKSLYKKFVTYFFTCILTLERVGIQKNGEHFYPKTAKLFDIQRQKIVWVSPQHRKS